MALTAESILDVLDESAASGWQEFSDSADLEYHALRLIAVRSRTGDDWGIVLDSIRGSRIDNTQPVAAGSWTKVYGSRIAIGMHLADHVSPTPLTVPEDRNYRSVRLDGIQIDGPAGKLVGDDGMIERLDLRPGQVCNFERYAVRPIDVIIIRAYLSAYPGSLWQPVEEVAAHAGVADGEILVVSDAFHHVVGPQALSLEGREDLAPLAVLLGTKSRRARSLKRSSPQPHQPLPLSPIPAGMRSLFGSSMTRSAGRMHCHSSPLMRRRRSRIRWVQCSETASPSAFPISS